MENCHAIIWQLSIKWPLTWGLNWTHLTINTMTLQLEDHHMWLLQYWTTLSRSQVFNLLPVSSISVYPYEVEDEQECLNVRPRRAVSTDQAYQTFKVESNSLSCLLNAPSLSNIFWFVLFWQSMGMKVATNLPIRAPQCLMYRGLNYYRNFYDGMSVGRFLR